MLHQHPTASRRPAELAGEIIDSTYALQLIQGFKEKFPGEVSKISIESAIIFNAIKDLSNVSGIRFMYGMESANDPTSKTILLIPCNVTSVHYRIPNTIVQPQGYLNSSGERVSLKRTWELLYNHAIHYAAMLPGIKFNRIMRGAFFGINTLDMLLKEYTNAEGVSYHFGWDHSIADQALQLKPVLQPLHADGAGYELYLDHGSPCPPLCDDIDDGCIVTNMVSAGNTYVHVQEQELNFYRSYRNNYLLSSANNGPLVEMYYYVSPALKEVILDTGRAAAIYSSLYNNEVQQCNKLIREGMYEAAKVLFEQTMENLMKTYLFR